MGALVNLGADPLLVETEEQAREVAALIERATNPLRQIEDDDEFETAMSRLDLVKENFVTRIFSFVADGNEGVICFPEDWC